MGLQIWMNDGLVDESKAKVSVFDHGLLYGDGVFEGIRVYGSKVFEHEAHVDRLYASAAAIRLEIPTDRDTLMENVRTTVAANNIEDGYVRLVITRGVGTLGLNPFLCEKAQIIIIADTIQLYPPELYESGLKVISANTVRNHPLSVSPQIKSLNYLNNILAKLEALDRDMLEAIMYNHEGFVAEATGDNVFVVRDGVIISPPNSAGSLEGINATTPPPADTTNLSRRSSTSSRRPTSWCRSPGRCRSIAPRASSRHPSRYRGRARPHRQSRRR